MVVNFVLFDLMLDYILSLSLFLSSAMEEGVSGAAENKYVCGAVKAGVSTALLTTTNMCSVLRLV